MTAHHLMVSADCCFTSTCEQNFANSNVAITVTPHQLVSTRNITEMVSIFFSITSAMTISLGLYGLNSIAVCT